MDPDPEPSSYGSGSGKSTGSLRIRIHNTATNFFLRTLKPCSYSYFISTTYLVIIIGQKDAIFLPIGHQILPQSFYLLRILLQHCLLAQLLVHLRNTSNENSLEINKIHQNGKDTDMSTNCFLESKVKSTLCHRPMLHWYRYSTGKIHKI
jgi:hypothetical protein